MAKPAAAPVKKSGSKTINRQRRSGTIRKCLPKALKVMFQGSTKTEFKSILKSWQESKLKSKNQAQTAKD